MTAPDIPPLPTRFLSIPQARKEVAPAFSDGAWRRMIFDGKLDDVVIRVGRRVLLDERKLISWLRNQSR